jgi:hypothetical protein
MVSFKVSPHQVLVTLVVQVDILIHQEWLLVLIVQLARLIQALVVIQ